MSLINLNQINVVDATTVAFEGSIIIARQFDDNLWSSNYDGAVLLPRGGPTARDAAIPVATDGYIHYNTNSLEFEGFTNGDWRPITQLTRDGTAAIPSRSFITDTDTGSFLSDVNTYSIAAGGVKQITVSSPINLRITSSDTGTGTIHWSDTLADRAFVRYNHLTDKFEFSGDGTNVSISIDGTTNVLTVLSDSIFNAPVTFNDTVSFGPSGGSFSSPGSFIFIIDDDNNDTSSVLKVQKHAGVDTGFQVTQTGTVQAAVGTEALPAFTFEGNTDTGWYFDTDPIDALVASFKGGDNIIIVDEHTTFTTRIRVPDGTALLPSITFFDHSTTGIFHKEIPVVTFNIAIETIEKLSISGTMIDNLVPIGLSDGTLADPSITFTADTDTGFFRPGSGTVEVSSDGTSVLTMDSSGIIMSGTNTVATSTGTAADPSFTFVGDEDTGIYNRDTNEIALATNGTERFYVTNTENLVVNDLLTESSLFLGALDS